MTDDLVKRLRSAAEDPSNNPRGFTLMSLMAEAADAIERLTAELSDTVDALDAEKLRHAMLFDELTKATAERDAAWVAGAKAMLEKCAAELKDAAPIYAAADHPANAPQAITWALCGMAAQLQDIPLNKGE